VPAEELGIQHLFVEPSFAERERLGITEIGHPVDFEKRERYWLKEIMSLKEFPVLFVLGAGHIESFTALAEGSGMPVEVVEEYFGREHFSATGK
jgi:hypothetical protein